MIRKITVRPFEYGLVFRNDAFAGLLEPGVYWRFDLLGRERIEDVSQRAPWLVHDQLDLIAAALRHQANAAKMFVENPTLLKLREIEAVERIAAGGKLNVVLGEKGLADRVVNLL
ncbi:MAG TPA: hypothetical protein VGJ05_07405 [Fimbriiglobus sp.]|jgi:hypothetical protein